MQYSEYPILKLVMLVCKVKHRSEALRIFATQCAVGLKCVPQLDVECGLNANVAKCFSQNIAKNFCEISMTPLIESYSSGTVTCGRLGPGTTTPGRTRGTSSATSSPPPTSTPPSVTRSWGRQPCSVTEFNICSTLQWSKYRYLPYLHSTMNK